MEYILLSVGLFLILLVIIIKLPDSQSQDDSSKIKYYFFGDFDVVVKEEGDLWYRRDPVKHKWINEGEWMARYYDAAYIVISVEYDEKNEEILNRSKIDSFWSADQDKYLKDEKKDDKKDDKEDDEKDDSKDCESCDDESSLADRHYSYRSYIYEIYKDKFIIVSDTAEHCHEQFIRWLIKEKYLICALSYRTRGNYHDESEQDHYIVINKGGAFEKKFEDLKNEETDSLYVDPPSVRYIDELSEDQLDYWCTIGENEERFRWVYVEKDNKKYYFIINRNIPRPTREMTTEEKYRWRSEWLAKQYAMEIEKRDHN